MTASGPSRRIAPPHNLVRLRGIAEVDGRSSIAEGDARDPSRTSRNRGAASLLAKADMLIA